MKTFILCFSVLLSAFSYSATGQATSAEQEIRALINDYVQKVDGMKNVQDAKNITQLFTPGFKSIRTDFLVDGTYKGQSIDGEQVFERLNSFASNIDQDVDLRLENINFLKVLGNKTAVVNYTVNFTLFNKKEELVSGSQNITSTIVNTDNGWKIANSHISEVRENIKKSMCNYEVFAKDQNAALLKVNVPAGSTFNTEFLDVELEETGSNSFIVSTDQGELMWENNKLTMPETGSNVMKNVTVSNRMALYGELVKHFFPEQCASVQLIK